MARSIIVLVALMLAGCQTAEKKLAAISTVEGQSRAQLTRPETPASCVAHMGRVKPKVGEKARWVLKRWEIVADARDALADNCQADLDDYWSRLEALYNQRIYGGTS